MVKKITFKVTSYEGDSEYTLLPKEAVRKIKQISKEENKWFFVNGEPRNTELLTEKELVKAQDDGCTMILVNALGGGDDNDKVKIDLEIIKKETDILIEFDVDEKFGNKLVTIRIGKDNLIDIVHDREIIVKALERKLDEFAEREVDGLRSALNI